jgi:hypothetical protein
MTTSAYSFLPWLRRGVASAIATAPGTASRAHVTVALTASGDARTGGPAPALPVERDVQLYGPGDIVGFDPRMVVRTDPRHWITNFEPNYLVTIEFYDEDFPWRYSPGVPDAGTGNLRPWIALLVLTEAEFGDRGPLPGRPLPFIEIGDPASLPPADELSAWAHVHSNRNVTASDAETVSTDLASVLPRLAAVIAENPDLACSRLVCPRRLEPDTAYHAFVVPAFETGRLAGLGADPAIAPDGLHPAWTDYPQRPEPGNLPYYYRWEFRTSSVGDFEYLVRLLQPRGVDARVGRRDLDVRDPGAGLPGIDDPALGGVLRLGGALKVPDTALTQEERDEQQAYDTWDRPGYPHPFQQALAALIDLADDYTGLTAPAAHAALTAVSDTFADSGLVTADDPDPLVTPPLYGRWHALTARLTATEGTADGWVEKLNLSPLYRVPAGTGGRIVRGHDEEYMQAAWDQLGEVLAANRRIRAAQVARELSFAFHDRHLTPLSAVASGALLTLSATLQGRVRTSIATLAPAAAAPRAVSSVLADSVIARTPVSPAMRRATRPGSRLMRRLPFGPPAGSGGGNDAHPSLVFDPAPPPPARQDLLPRMNAGLVFAAAPKTAPDVVTVDRLEEILAGPIITLTRIANPVETLPTSADFVLTLPGDPARPTGGGADSTEATRFKQALTEMYAAFNVAADAGDTPARFAVDVDALAEVTLAGLHPDLTVPRRALGGISLPGRFRPPDPPVIGPAPVDAPDPLTEVMAYPVIDQPMFQPLAAASADLFCPNVNLVEPNSITLLETNPPFIESYLMGLNHEMARELLWREYPTDQRGSVFRQFWDPRATLRRPGETADDWRERVRDIPPIHTWAPATALGEHDNRATPGQKLVLVIRGELLKKYPTAVIYANKARWQPSDAAPDPTRERVLVPLDPGEEADPPLTKIRMPLFEAKVEPDIYFIGFDLKEEEAIGGTGQPGDTEAGWFFVLKERPGEPRFGLDVEPAGPLEVWNDLAWPDVLPPGQGPYLRLEQHVPALAVPTGATAAEKTDQHTEDVAVTWNGAISSADLAYVLYQAPVLVAVHAREMLRHG